MTTVRSAHSRLLEQLIEQWKAKLVEGLTGVAYPDYASYRQCVGRFEGLNDALKFSEEADFKLNGDDVVDR